MTYPPRYRVHQVLSSRGSRVLKWCVQNIANTDINSEILSQKQTIYNQITFARFCGSRISSFKHVNSRLHNNALPLFVYLYYYLGLFIIILLLHVRGCAFDKNKSRIIHLFVGLFCIRFFQNVSYLTQRKLATLARRHGHNRTCDYHLKR